MKEDYLKPEIQEMDSALFFPVVHGNSNDDETIIDPGANEGESWN